MPSARPLPFVVMCSVIGAIAAGAPTPARAADADTYTIDPVHTRVMVAISHAGFSDAIGTVSGSTGVLVFDRGDWRSARLDVRVPIARLDFGDAKWNAAALATNLLDGARHPDAHFVSTSVEPVGVSANGANPAESDHAKVCGELTLRGVTRPLCLDVTLNAVKRHPMPPFRRTAGFSATATLRRGDYGIDAWRSVIGDTVALRIEAEAMRSNAVADRDSALPAATTTPPEASIAPLEPATTTSEAPPPTTAAPPKVPPVDPVV